MEVRGDGETGDPQERLCEEHRPFLRQANHRLAVAYGLGGLSVLGSSVAILVGGWAIGLLTQPATWLGAIAVALFGLWALRFRIDRLASREADALRQYCAVNGVGAVELMEYFDGHAVFPYLDAVKRHLGSERAVGRGEPS